MCSMLYQFSSYWLRWIPVGLSLFLLSAKPFYPLAIFGHLEGDPIILLFLLSQAMYRASLTMHVHTIGMEFCAVVLIMLSCCFREDRISKNCTLFWCLIPHNTACQENRNIKKPAVSVVIEISYFLFSITYQSYSMSTRWKTLRWYRISQLYTYFDEICSWELFAPFHRQRVS